MSIYKGTVKISFGLISIASTNPSRTANSFRDILLGISVGYFSRHWKGITCRGAVIQKVKTAVSYIP